MFPPMAGWIACRPGTCCRPAGLPGGGRCREDDFGFCAPIAVCQASQTEWARRGRTRGYGRKERPFGFLSLCIYTRTVRVTRGSRPRQRRWGGGLGMRSGCSRGSESLTRPHPGPLRVPRAPPAHGSWRPSGRAGAGPLHPPPFLPPATWPPEGCFLAAGEGAPRPTGHRGCSGASPPCPGPQRTGGQEGIRGMSERAGRWRGRPGGSWGQDGVRGGLLQLSSHTGPARG